MITIPGIKRNTVLSAILAGVLLFPLIPSIPSSATQATLIPSDGSALNTSIDVNSSLIATPSDESSNMTSKNNATQTVNKGNNASKLLELESGSNSTLFFKNEIKNETGFVSNVTNATGDVTSIINAIGQSSGATGDFNGDGIDDLAIGAPREDLETCCTCPTNLPISTVTASGNDGNVPQNVLDNNLATRWSSFGIGQSITADLGFTHSFCSVGIAWYKGDQRQYAFDISISNDGTTFRKITDEGTISSGTTINSERTSFTPFNARYVMVTVNGNTDPDPNNRNWASLTELDIFQGPAIVDSGAVNVIYGSTLGLNGTEISQGNGQFNQMWDQSSNIEGDPETDDQFGASLATGDFNKDGFSDLAIGVPAEDFDSNNDGIDDIRDAGAVNVIYGTPLGLFSSKLTTGEGRDNQIWTQRITGGLEPGDLFGYTLTTGDFNKDGFSDLAIGVPAEDINNVPIIQDTGAVNVIYGSSDGLRADAISPGNGRNNQIYTQESPDIVGHTNEAGDWFGSALGTGDFNRDGISDLAIGIAEEDLGTVNPIQNAGQVIVIYGSSDGLSGRGVSPGDGRVHQIWSQGNAGIRDLAEMGDRFGHALATGDFNKDTFADLAIGVWEEKVGNIRFSGAVNVIYGTSDGLRPTAISQGNGRDNQIWMQGVDGVNDNAEEGDRFGTTLETGDFNKDGRSDLAIGAPFEDLGLLDGAGVVNVIYGSTAGLSTSEISLGNGRDDQIWMQNSTNVEGDPQGGDLFGLALATGDFNNDTISDLAIGVPGEDVDLFDAPAAGAINVIYGSTGLVFGSGGLSPTVPLGGIGRADQLWTQGSPNIHSDPEPEDRFGSSLG